MTGALAERLGLGQHELISIVGAGGKTTILQALGSELASRDHKVILTTTTRMAPDQIADPICWSDDPGTVESELCQGTALVVMCGRIPEKVTGLNPVDVDRLYLETSANYILVEADGARSMSIKAPADHEPVIPKLTTTVIVVIGADALGRPLGEAAHRLDRIHALTGLGRHDVVTAGNAAMILLHPQGGLKSIPDAARVVIAVTKVTAELEVASDELVSLLMRHPRIDRAIPFQAMDSSAN